MSDTVKVRNKCFFPFTDTTNPDAPVPFEPGVEVDAVETDWVKTQLKAGVLEVVEVEAEAKKSTGKKAAAQ